MFYDLSVSEGNHKFPVNFRIRNFRITAVSSPFRKNGTAYPAHLLYGKTGLSFAECHFS